MPGTISTIELILQTNPDSFNIMKYDNYQLPITWLNLKIVYMIHILNMELEL